MLRNFHMVAITRAGRQTELFHIPLHQGLQNTLTEEWDGQYAAFINDIEEVDFDPGYKPDEHERFCLTDYEPPGWLLDESSASVSDLESVSGHEDRMDSIKGLAAFAQDDDSEKVVLFQNFSRTHVIRPGRFLFLRNDTYESTQRPGLTLDRKLSAVLLPAQRKLLFRSFRTTNTFLPLAEFYEEASEQEIRTLLAHKRLAPENVDALVDGSNQWFRKRFAMLRDSGILDRFTANQIAAHADGYEVSVQVNRNKIVFPADKAQAKRLLQFLNEEIFRGAITETLYETNSKREAD